MVINGGCIELRREKVMILQSLHCFIIGSIEKFGGWCWECVHYFYSAMNTKINYPRTGCHNFRPTHETNLQPASFIHRKRAIDYRAQVYLRDIHFHHEIFSADKSIDFSFVSRRRRCHQGPEPQKTGGSHQCQFSILQCEAPTWDPQSRQRKDE